MSLSSQAIPPTSPTRATPGPSPVTSSPNRLTTIDKLIKDAEAARGMKVLRPDVLETALYKFILTWLDLQRYRDNMLNGVIKIALRGRQGMLEPKGSFETHIDD